MNKRIFKKILIIAILFMVLFMAYRIISIYAIFYSEGQGRVVQSNATWTIYLNQTNVTSRNSNTFEVDTFELEENSHVSTGKIAPGTRGSFYIELNPENTNVSIRYDIEIDKTQIPNDSIQIVSIEEIEEGNTLTKTDESTYTGIIPLQELQQGKINKIKIKIEWKDIEENNRKDTLIGTGNSEILKVPVNVKVTQYLGEKIEEYIPTVGENNETI